MGEYVININWSGRKGRDSEKKLKTYQKGTSLLPAAVLAGTFDQNSVSPNIFYGFSDIQGGDGQETREWQKIQQGAVLSQVQRFF